MRVLIRERSSARFLGDRQEWVPARERGLDFVNTIMARSVATRLHLKDVEVVLDVGGPGEEIVLEVPDASENPPNVV
jgi:hypothetical protein